MSHTGDFPAGTRRVACWPKTLRPARKSPVPSALLTARTRQNCVPAPPGTAPGHLDALLLRLGGEARATNILLRN